MRAPHITELSEREKQCLRLFYANYNIKEIAAELKLSSNTVNEHLRSARRLLGTNRSMQAARMLFEYEHSNIDVSNPNSVDRRWDSDHPDSAATPVSPADVARNRQQLSILIRIGMMIAIAFSALALAGSLIVSASAITRFFVDHEIDISDPPYR